jgi:hypothetical protein
VQDLLDFATAFFDYGEPLEKVEQLTDPAIVEAHFRGGR